MRIYPSNIVIDNNRSIPITYSDNIFEMNPINIIRLYNNESEANESEANEIEANESDVNESEANESEANESEANESEANESEANESEVNESEANETEANETEANETEANESETNEIEANETEATESESNESEESKTETTEYNDASEANITNEENNLNDSYNEPICIICLDIINHEKIFLECTHSFHIECIIKWANKQIFNKRNTSCPICKLEYEYNTLVATILKHKVDIVKTYIKQLKFVLNNNKFLLYNDKKYIKMLLIKYNLIIETVKTTKNTELSKLVNIVILPLPDNIRNIIHSTESIIESKQANDLKLANYYKNYCYCSIL